MKKIMLLLALFSTSCTVIHDKDGDGISSLNEEFKTFYKDRSERHMFYMLAEGGILTSEVWHMGATPINFQMVEVDGAWYNKRLEIHKEGIVYAQVRDNNKNPIVSENNVFNVFEIIQGTDTGKFVIMTIEPSPSVASGFMFLLVSKTKYSTQAAAVAELNSETLNIPTIDFGVPMAELVFDPDVAVEPKFYSLEEQLAKIKENFEPIEFFGSKTFTEKVAELESLNYNIFTPSSSK